MVPASLLKNNVRLVKAGMILLPWNVLAKGALGGPVGEVTLLPFSKYKTLPSPMLRQLPWHPNHQVVMAEMFESSGRPWVHCPRERLNRAIALLRQHNLVAKAGFELEFILFHSDCIAGSHPSRLGRTGTYAGFEAIDVAATCLDEMVSALAQLHIPVRMVHAEVPHGGYEIVLGHKDVMDAVNDLVLARETIRNVARKHNLIATFVPKCSEHEAGNGQHVHISLDNHFGTQDKVHGEHVGMTETAQSFMAGVLDALPWLAFLTNASVLSYERFHPQCWVGIYKAWGMNNKETPLRIAEDRSNFELKTLDGMSNPYLAIAGVLVAGLNGVIEHTELPKPFSIDPFTLPESRRPVLLPTSLEESLANFRESARGEIFEEVFPKEMIHDLACVKLEEIEYAKEKDVDEYLKEMMRVF